jgi:hypothetical protein
VPPVNSGHIVVGAAIKQVAPDRYLHPVHMMRRFPDALPGNTLTEAQFGPGRIQIVDSTAPGNPPVSVADATLVQPTQGAGPGFLARLIARFKRWPALLTSDRMLRNLGYGMG